ncbi:MAG: alpha/beta fold hydrolase [Candidatus Auribacterota bacterium]
MTSVFLIILAVIAIIFIILTALVCRIILNIFLNISITTARDDHPDVPGEDVMFPSEDGVTLHGKFIPARGKAKKTIVFCHEVGAGSGSWYKYISFLPEAGYNIFTFDFRGHGSSHSTNGYAPNQWFSHYEVHDFNGALDYVLSRPEVADKEVGVVGISRGGAVAVYCAAQRKEIRAIVMDSAFSTYETLFDYISRWACVYLPVKGIHPWPNHYLSTISLILAQIKLRHRLPRMERRLKQLQIPLFFIHGERDSYIPVDQAHRLFAMAKEPKQLLTVPKARHNESVVVQPDTYKKRVMSFFSEYLP